MFHFLFLTDTKCVSFIFYISKDANVSFLIFEEGRTWGREGGEGGGNSSLDRKGGGGWEGGYLAGFQKFKMKDPRFIYFQKFEIKCIFCQNEKRTIFLAGRTPWEGVTVGGRMVRGEEDPHLDGKV